MPDGYCTGLVKQISDIANGNAPGKKLNLAGFLKMLFCCQNSSASPINDGYESGHTRPLVIGYRKRPTEDVVGDEDNCDIDRIPAKSEWTIPGLLFKKTSFFLSDDEISKYCKESSQSASIGGQSPTGFMKEHYDVYLEHVAVLMQAINKSLVSLMSTQFGNNAVDGSLWSYININRSGADLALDDGIIRLLTDISDNRICEDPCLVGNGVMAAYDLIKALQCCTGAGINPAGLGLPQFFKDPDTAPLWGQNSFGVFAKGSVKFIGRDRYVGNFAGAKGGSIFFNVPFPVNEFQCVDMGQCLNDLKVDVQMKYIDCPTTIDVEGTPTEVKRGWLVILSKYYHLWVQPTDMYDDDDPLAGTNGTLRYFASNEAGSPGGYGYTG